MAERSIENLQLDGGCLVFDFTNTINNRAEPEHDYLKSYDDMLLWGQKAGMIPPERFKLLLQHAAKNSEERDVAFIKIIRARETIYPLFSAIAKRKAPDKSIAQAFNILLSDCLGKLQLDISSAHASPSFTGSTLSLEEPLCMVMKSAYDILTAENFSRLKECPRCGWLFVDRTKNGKRRWCDMNVCGSIVKATRYYHKKKEESK